VYESNPETEHPAFIASSLVAHVWSAPNILKVIVASGTKSPDATEYRVPDCPEYTLSGTYTYNPDNK
jgi:hypothetical protein